MIHDLLIAPFGMGFMRRALAGCLALSVSGPPLGVFLVLRRMSLMSDVLQHGILPGIALGAAAVQAGHKVRYHTAADLAETLYRGLADNSVGRVIDTLLRNDLILIDLCRPRDYAVGLC